MAVINHDIRSVNGKYIFMPPDKAGQSGWGNLAIPNVMDAGGDTVQQYPINTKFVDFDRTFIYGYCDSKSAYTKANIGLANMNREENITFGTVGKDSGDTTLGVLTPTTYKTTADANFFAGGWFMSRANPYGWYRIVSNTAYNGGTVGSTEMDIVIEEPGIQVDIAASVGSCKLNANPYTTLKGNWYASDEMVTYMGVTLIDPTASTYQWIQTWGPCGLPSDELAGQGNYLRQVWFGIDGSIYSGASVVPSGTQSFQPLGWILNDTHGGAATWMVQIMLER